MLQRQSLRRRSSRQSLSSPAPAQATQLFLARLADAGTHCLYIWQSRSSLWTERGGGLASSCALFFLEAREKCGGRGGWSLSRLIAILKRQMYLDAMELGIHERSDCSDAIPSLRSVSEESAAT
jgi:hypothetical protein